MLCIVSNWFLLFFDGLGNFQGTPDLRKYPWKPLEGTPDLICPTLFPYPDCKVMLFANNYNLHLQSLNMSPYPADFGIHQV